MPAINWAFLCNNAFLDAAGRPCLNGIFENLAMGGLPATLPQMSIGIQVSMAGGESGEFTLLVISPTGRELNRQAALYTAPPRGGDQFLPFSFTNTAFSETGEHFIKILYDGIPIHSFTFNVRIL